MDAGRIAAGTSPKAATPDDRERTPEPTHALMRLNVEDFIEAQDSASTLHASLSGAGVGVSADVASECRRVVVNE
jgi:hypothetical protein